MIKKPNLLLTAALAVFSINGNCTDIPAPKITGTISLHDLEADGEKLYYTCAIEEEEKHIRFFEFDHNHWHEILLPAEAKAASHLDLKIFSGVPYILYTESEGMTLIKYEGGQWFQVGKPKFGSDISMIMNINYTLVNSIPYIIFDNYDSKKSEIMMLEISGNLQIWMNPDANALIPSDAEKPYIASDINNTVYTAWFDKKTGKVQASKLANNDEQLTDISKGLAVKNINAVKGLYAFGNDLYIVLTNEINSMNFTIQKYDASGSKWVTLGTTETMSGTDILLTENLNTLVRDLNNNILGYYYSNSVWTSNDLVNLNDATNTKFTASGNDLYMAYLNVTTGILNIKKF